MTADPDPTGLRRAIDRAAAGNDPRALGDLAELVERWARVLEHAAALADADRRKASTRARPVAGTSPATAAGETRQENA